jgi:hypothetical protein
MKLFTLIGLAASYSFKLESQNSSSRYRELYNLAQALMQAKRKNEKKKKSFRTYRASCKLQLQARDSCSFNAECYNSSSHYTEVLIDAPALIQVKNKSKVNSYIAHPQGHIRATASKHIFKTQALLTESFGLKP